MTLERMVAGALASVALVLAWLPTSGSAGSACTITGTSRFDDVLIGTAGPDVICGKGGGDILSGKGGDDVLIGGPGGDRIVGDAGDDVLKGGLGADYLWDDTGRDRLLGGGGRDSCLWVDDGHGGDVVDGGAESDGFGADPNDTVRSAERRQELCIHPPIPIF